MQSDFEGAVNIGSPQYVSVKELVDTVAGVAGKRFNVRHVDGPVGVRAATSATPESIRLDGGPDIRWRTASLALIPGSRSRYDESAERLSESRPVGERSVLDRIRHWGRQRQYESRDGAVRTNRSGPAPLTNEP